MSTDHKDFSLGSLSLEPLDAPATPSSGKGPAKFHANTRDKIERRVAAERRQQFRLESDRRTGKDRRPKTSWEPGSNL